LGDFKWSVSQMSPAKGKIKSLSPIEQIRRIHAGTAFCLLKYLNHKCAWSSKSEPV
jgi:hypothetical protein